MRGKDVRELIVASLIFMVAGFIFLMLGRGSEPNVYQFLSIAASLVAGTLLVMGYLKERKRRPARAAESTAVDKGEEAGGPADAGADIEADLKALEEGFDEEELEPAAARREPLVSSATARKASKRGTYRASPEKSQVLEPAMAAAASGPGMPNTEPSAAADPGDHRGPSPEAGTFASGAANAGPADAGEREPGSGSSSPGLASANREWASLIGDVDERKFEPPPLEKPKSKSKAGKPEAAQTDAGSRKAHIDMTQPAAAVSQEKASTQPQEGRRGLFGLFRRKPSQAPQAPPSVSSDEPKGMPEKTAPGMVPGGRRESEPAEVSPQAVAEEPSAAQEQVAEGISDQKEAGGPVTRPETAPIGESLEAVAANAGGGGRPVKAKSARGKAAAKRKAASAKPRTGGKPKTATKTKATTAKPKAVRARATEVKPKAASPTKPKTAKTSKAPTAGKTPKTGRTAKATRKSKSPASPKARGPGSL